MGKRLSDGHIAGYEDDGFVFPTERAFHAAAVPRFREANREETLRYETAA